MKALLIYPNVAKEIIGWGDLGAIAEPLALEYLATAAKQCHTKAKLLDLRIHPDSLEPTLAEFQPDIVAVTGYSMHVLRNLDICKTVKGLCPQAKTIVGGHHATLMPEDYFEPQIDAIVIGEGVWPFTQLLTRIQQQQSFADIPGVWYQSQDGFNSGGPPRQFEMDDIPLPDRSITESDRYHYFIDWMKPIALLRTSVGCPYRCSFCSLWRIMDGKYHTRETERIIHELQQIEERYVFLVDDEPFVNQRRMTELGTAIQQADIEKEYFAYCRVDTLMREQPLMKLWKSIGLKRVFLGIEAISEQGLQEFNKRVQLQQVEESLQVARTLGIDVFAQFIINTNFTQKDFKRLVRFIQRNKIEYPSFTILTPIPGTGTLDTFDHITEIQPNGRPNWARFDLQHPVVETALPRQVFLEEYHQLHQIFDDQYLNYRATRQTSQKIPVLC